MTPKPKPDAVRSPLNHAGSGDSFAKVERLQREFAPVLGVPQVFIRHQGSEHFLTGQPGDTLNGSSLAPLAGIPRYLWADRGDGVLYGYLHDGP